MISGKAAEMVELGVFFGRMGIIITESLQKHYVEIMASHEGVVGMAFAQVAEVSPDWAPKKLPVWTTGT